MFAQHALPDFRCRSSCQHTECQRHCHLGITYQNEICKCIENLNSPSAFLENILDMAKTLCQIMIICGVHECKAKSTIDISTFAFLHFDQVCYCMDTAPKKRIRKEDLFHELGRRCLMNRVEAHLCYTIIKNGFKAFYFKQNTYDPNIPDRQLFSEECAYVHAARKTAEAYARYDGLSCEAQRAVFTRIKLQYKKFYDEMQVRKAQPEGDNCNCCFCVKAKGQLVNTKTSPCTALLKRKNQKCSVCVRKKQKFTHSKSNEFKCPKCLRPKQYCICNQNKFSLCFVKSIWERPDFSLYIKQVIDDVEKLRSASSPCGRISDTQLRSLSTADVIRGCEVTETDSEEVVQDEDESLQEL